MISQDDSEDRPKDCSEADPESSVTGAVVHNMGGKKKRSRGGGPKTVAGKQISSQNATSHGILSRRPVVGDEKLGDWLALLNATRTSLQPGSPFEEVIVNLLCHNLWLQYRQIQWHTGVIQSQIDAAGFRSRRTVEQEHETLPEDERIWSGYDAGAVRTALEIIHADREVTIDSCVGAGALLAVSVVIVRIGGTQTDANFDLSYQPSTEVSTAELRERIGGMTEANRLQLEVVIHGAIAEADAAALCQEKRREGVRINDSKRMASAYSLSDENADKDMRYRAQLGREFERMLRHLETVQAARNGIPSERVRVEVDGFTD